MNETSSPLSRDEFAATVERLRSQRHPGPPSGSSVLAALSTVIEGTVVPLGGPPPLPQLADDEPGVGPYRHRQWLDSGDGWQAVNDRLELDVHGAASMTHLDALEHFSWHQSSQPPADEPTLPADTLAPWAGGWIGRGVLVDASDVPAGHQVTPDELAEIMRREHVQLRRGDALVISFGRHHRHRRSDVPLGGEPETGLSIACADWLADLIPALVITDWGLDGHPSEIPGVPAPWHVLCLTALRIPLVDMAALGALVSACRDRDRYDFALILAALPIPHASGSPVNPLALF